MSDTISNGIVAAFAPVMVASNSLQEVQTIMGMTAKPDSTVSFTLSQIIGNVVQKLDGPAFGTYPTARQQLQDAETKLNTHLDGMKDADSQSSADYHERAALIAEGYATLAQARVEALEHLADQLKDAFHELTGENWKPYVKPETVQAPISNDKLAAAKAALAKARGEQAPAPQVKRAVAVGSSS